MLKRQNPRSITWLLSPAFVKSLGESSSIAVELKVNITSVFVATIVRTTYLAFTPVARVSVCLRSLRKDSASVRFCETWPLIEGEGSDVHGLAVGFLLFIDDGVRVGLDTFSYPR